MVRKAIELKPDYDDAMAYMNLMYRERADIQCGDPKANASDLKSADRLGRHDDLGQERKNPSREVPSRTKQAPRQRSMPVPDPR